MKHQWIFISRETFKAFSKISDKHRKIAIFKNDFFIHMKFIQGDVIDILTSLVYSGIECIYHEGKIYPSLKQIIKNKLLLPRYEKLALDLKKYCERRFS